MSEKIVFEQPLNERIRTFLRIEQLMQRCEFCLGGQTRWDTHCALTTLLELIELAARSDIKSELMKELKRQLSTLEALESAPGVNQSHLQAIVERQRQLIEGLHNIDGQPGGQLQGNEFLNSIKQRAVIPGGTCDFDLPAYHYWLAQPSLERNHAIETWLQPFKQLYDSIATILELIRGSATSESVHASKGFYQRSLDAAQPFQLVRIQLPATSDIYPEISAGKHRFSVRFLEQPEIGFRAIQSEADIDFELVCCAL